MSKRTSRKTKKRVRVNKGRVFLIALSFVLIIAVGVSIKNIFDLRTEQKELTEINHKLAEEKNQLKEELKNVNDYDYIEEQARIQLKLIKPGEILYILDEELPEKDKDTKDDK